MGSGRPFVVRAVYENGVLRLRSPLPVEEHSEVSSLAIRPTGGDPDDPTGWKAIHEYTGSGQEPSTDASEKHDDDPDNDPH